MKNLVQLDVGNTDRNPSPSLWRTCPWDEIGSNLVDGVRMWDDFTDFPITPPTTEGNWGRYAAFTSTGGTMLPDDTLGGAVNIGSDDDNEAASFRTFATPFKLVQGNKEFWFEARVQKSTIAATKHGFFVGLLGRLAITTSASTLTAITPITDAGVIADTNIVGFHSTETSAGTVDTIYKADGVTEVTVQANAVQLVAATYVKLGMHYVPSGDRDGQYRLSWWADGVRLSTSYGLVAGVGTDFPNRVNMGLVFAVKNATGTTPGTSGIDWWRAAQLV